MGRHALLEDGGKAISPRGAFQRPVVQCPQEVEDGVYRTFVPLVHGLKGLRLGEHLVVLRLHLLDEAGKKLVLFPKSHQFLADAAHFALGDGREVLANGHALVGRIVSRRLRGFMTSAMVLVAIAVLVVTLAFPRLWIFWFLNQPHELWPPTLEKLVLIHAWDLAFVFARPHGVVRQAHAFVEAVHVELADKGRVVVVFEEMGDEVFGKLFFVRNDEGISIVGPPDKLFVWRVVDEAGNVSKAILWPRGKTGCLAFLA